MKKLAIGCLIVAVVLGIGAGIAGYWVYNRARAYVRQFEAIGELDKKVTNTAVFAAPAGGELTEAMVRRFAAVQESMRARLGARVEEMRAKQDAFLKSQQAEGRPASPREALAVLTDVARLILEAKTAQVDALNAQHFSLGEYSWVRGQVYTAAGLDIAELSFKNLPELMRQGGAATKPIAQAGASVPARNKELVAPLLPKLKDWAPLAFFGL